jgi:hypothetical protein
MREGPTPGFAAGGWSVQRFLTDNGNSYCSHLFAAVLPGLGLGAPARPALQALHERQGGALDPDPGSGTQAPPLMLSIRAPPSPKA